MEKGSGYFASIINACLAVNDEYIASDQSDVGLKLGHWSEAEVCFYDVPDSKLDWLRATLNGIGVPYQWDQVFIANDTYMVTIKKTGENEKVPEGFSKTGHTSMHFKHTKIKSLYAGYKATDEQCLFVFFDDWIKIQSDEHLKKIIDAIENK